MVLQVNFLEDGQLVSLDLKEQVLGQGLVGHITCAADVLSVSATRSLASSFEVSTLFKCVRCDLVLQGLAARLWTESLGESL